MLYYWPNYRIYLCLRRIFATDFPPEIRMYKLCIDVIFVYQMIHESQRVCSTFYTRNETQKMNMLRPKRESTYTRGCLIHEYIRYCNEVFTFKELALSIPCNYVITFISFMEINTENSFTFNKLCMSFCFA